MINLKTFLPDLSTTSAKKRLLTLLQFFLIIFVYHTLKDLKDSLVITGSNAGAEVIPFIKIWGMLPLAFIASYFFSKLYNKFGREKTFYFFTFSLLSLYLVFACFLYPIRETLFLNNLYTFLTRVLPTGAKGFIAMITNWHYTLFYLAAELWSLLILSILFWGYVNENTSLKEAKKFYPLCMFVGNFAGILSGQTSHYLCHTLTHIYSWEETLKIMILMVSFCGLIIMGINRTLYSKTENLKQDSQTKLKQAHSFKDNLLAIFQSKPLFYIASLVVGFGLTSNLIEVVWKESIRSLHPSPQAYNAYINQLTSYIGFFAVCMAFLSRFIFNRFSWSKVALITPVTLLMTSFIFFSSLMMPEDYLNAFSSFLGMSPILLIVTLGSMHYVLGLTAKYTLFDTSKEMAFLSIESEERLRAKSVIDSIGSRFGKSGASCLYQLLLLTSGAASSHISIIGISSIFVIGFSIFATKKLGAHLSRTNEYQASLSS